MIYYTYGQLRTKLELDLDLQDETFITPDEMVGYFNEAIDEAEAEILKIHEDYFLNDHTPTLVAGTSQYALPTDIYAAKIRGVVYSSGGLIYPVNRIPNFQKFLDLAETTQFGSAERYRYYIKNDVPTSTTVTNVFFVLAPTSREAGTPITIWYIRQANRVPLVTGGSQGASDAIVIDIPEFFTFLLWKVKTLCLSKDGIDPRLEKAELELERQRKLMVDTLTEMVLDDDNEIQGDLSHYTEHS